MVKYIFMLFVVFFHINALGQNNLEGTYTFLSRGPCFPGGIDSLTRFIQKSINYPITAIKDSLEGRVYINFWIDIDGSTIDHKVTRGIREDLNLEALRISKLIYFSNPAMQRDRPIKVPYTIVVKFELPKTKALRQKEDFTRKKKRRYSREMK